MTFLFGFSFGNDPFGLLVLLAIGLLPFIFWLWALIDVLRHEFKGSNEKVIWTLVIIFIPIGFILYFIIGRKNRVLKELRTK